MSSKDRAWTHSDEDDVYAPGMLLPAFDVVVRRSAPTAVVIINGMGTPPDISLAGSGDAFSASYFYIKHETSVADQEFRGLDEGYLKRILLYILNAEEYKRLVIGYGHDLNGGAKGMLSSSSLQEWVADASPVEDSDRAGQVRLSDLRLATEISPIALRRETKEVLRELELPVSSDVVLRWKWETLRGYATPLKKPAEWTEEERMRERDRVVATSFCAATVLLLLDLDAHNLHEADSDKLLTKVVEVARLIRNLAESLYKSTQDFKRLLRPPGKQKDPSIKYYTALHYYRMGYPLRSVARASGITPRPLTDEREYSKDAAPGNPNWLNKTKERIRAGVEIERQEFPSAASLFERRYAEDVRKEAIETYRRYIEEAPWSSVEGYLSDSPVYAGIDLLGGIPANRDEELYRAYVQLGSCIDNGIHPTDPDKSFPD